VIVSTAIGLLALVIGLIIGWPVLVLLSIIFTIVQIVMLAAKTAVERNDVKVAERLAAKKARHERG
jgi:type III secretory pathway component EscV|tara:strand:- start:1752 stop:1949 length:198 start_codon:yes stop_codon:yes gene_type:complete